MAECAGVRVALGGGGGSDSSEARIKTVNGPDWLRRTCLLTATVQAWSARPNGGSKLALPEAYRAIETRRRMTVYREGPDRSSVVWSDSEVWFMSEWSLVPI
jgi:hypothetical protein